MVRIKENMISNQILHCFSYLHFLNIFYEKIVHFHLKNIIHCKILIVASLSLTCDSAKPTEIVESEPEQEFVSTLPQYDLPTKRDKTELEQHATPEKVHQQKIKPVMDEPSPDWDRLKKKAKSEEDPIKIIAGKGSTPGNKMI